MPEGHFSRPVVQVIWEEGTQGFLTQIFSERITAGAREGAVSYKVYVNTEHPVVKLLKLVPDVKLALAIVATELAVYIGQHEPEDGARLIGGDLSIEQRPDGHPIDAAGCSIIARYAAALVAGHYRR